jgi:hypothetical protein
MKKLLFIAALLVSNLANAASKPPPEIEPSHLISVAVYPRILLFNYDNWALSESGQILVCKLSYESRKYPGRRNMCVLEVDTKTNRFEDALSLNIPGYDIDAFEIKGSPYPFLVLYLKKK